ncbi:S9 family peptidase [Nocardia mangyaensis]|uniref:S9 family peptidase n=1 Tax=Nocardia mangyaensis TaxID=2213200 RepID=A0A1J0VZ74_9NOCA|nr:S9 family peptidase [Nocardia mangyaensis]APE37408.1 S9 family peptidase [Nocardia mangyaensis]
MATELIPRSALFGLPGRPRPALSPDGTRIGYVDSIDGVANIWVGPADNLAAAVPVTHDRGRGVRSFVFCHDSSTLLYAQDTDGDENWRIYGLNLDNGHVRQYTPGQGVRATMLAHSRFHPTTVLIGLPGPQPRYVDPYRLDLVNGQLEQVATNPGYRSWLIDSDLRLRGGAIFSAAGGLEIYLRDRATGIDRLWMMVDPEDTATTGLPTFDRDDATMYMLSSVGAQTRRLVQIDVETGESTVLAAHDIFDVASVYSDPDTGRPQSVVFAGDLQIWQHLDATFGATVDKLRDRLGGDISITRSTAGRRWLVAKSSDRAPSTFHCYDLPTNTITELDSGDRQLDDFEFAAMEPFTFRARDGLGIHGYLTFPVDELRRDLPAVLLVHGGPQVRDSWRFQPRVQWLANRGYLVIQVNFRGSTGYGKTFVNAGDREWGRAMHHDLVDAVDHVVAQGWADPKRVAIYGGSFGGYAALCGAAFTPETFCAAIDVCGPSNILTLLGSLSAQYQSQIGVFHRQVGNPDTDADMLWERSPLSRAADISIPLMIVQGRTDPRVKVEEAEQIVAALTESGIAHEYILFDDEGHGVLEPDNSERLHAAIEHFLAEHLGGREEPATETEN